MLSVLLVRVSGNKSEMRLLMDEIQKDLATVDFVDEVGSYFGHLAATVPMAVGCVEMVWN